MATETDPPTESAPAPGKSKKILMLLVIVVGVIVGGGSGVFLAGPLLASKVGPKAPAADSTEAAAAEGEHGEHGAAKGAAVHVVENMVLNPANSGGSRFLLISVAFSVKNEQVSETMTERDPELRDVILRNMGEYDVDALADITRRDSMKTTLQGAVQDRFGKGTVLAVYFPQFVIQ